MSDVYHNPEEFGLEPVFEADAGGSYEFDKLVIWRKLSDGSLLMGTDSGCSCPSPFEDATDIKALEVATPEAINSWFNDGPSPRRDKLEVGLRQKALALFQERPVKNDNLDAEIRDAEAALEKLRTKKANRAKLTPIHHLAIEMHDAFCHARNHSEDCGWHYEIDSSEVHDWSRYAHALALRQAEAAAAVIGVDAAMSCLKAVRGVR